MLSVFHLKSSVCPLPCRCRDAFSLSTFTCQVSFLSSFLVTHISISPVLPLFPLMLRILPVFTCPLSRWGRFVWPQRLIFTPLLSLSNQYQINAALFFCFGCKCFYNEPFTIWTRVAEASRKAAWMEAELLHNVSLRFDFSCCKSDLPQSLSLARISFCKSTYRKLQNNASVMLITVWADNDWHCEADLKIWPTSFPFPFFITNQI